MSTEAAQVHKEVDHTAAEQTAAPKTAANPHKAANDNVENPSSEAKSSPFSKGLSKAKKKFTSSASTVVEGTDKVGRLAKKVLRAGELEKVHQVSIPATPFYVAGQIIDGTVLSAARRGLEIAEPTAAGTLAMFRTLGIPFSPIHSISHPIQTIKKPARIFTSTLMMGKNLGMALPRAAHELADRGIARPIEQISTQLRRVPLVGGLIATPTSWVSRKVANTIGTITNGIDLISSPIDYLHNLTSPDGAAATPSTPAAHH